MHKSEQQRPFLDFWENLETLELKRRKGEVPDDRHSMTLAFIEQIGERNFIEHANKVHALREIARFYGIELRDPEDLSELLKQIESNPTHKEIFYYGFYFAAWVKQEVPAFQRTFRSVDEQIMIRVEEGGSLQSILRDIVMMIGYKKFRRYFETMGVNRVHLFLEFKKVRNEDDLTRLDDLESRHLLDQLVMKTGLKQMRFCDVQTSVGQTPITTDQRKWLKPLACVPED